MVKATENQAKKKQEEENKTHQTKAQMESKSSMTNGKVSIPTQHRSLLRRMQGASLLKLAYHHTQNLHPLLHMMATFNLNLLSR